MNELCIFLVALLSLPYILVPILIRRNHSFAVEPKLRSISSGFLPEAIEARFKQTSATFEKIGFEARLDAVSLDFGPDLRIFMRLFVETKNSFVAVCSALLPDGASEPIRNFIEFSSRYVDGHEISTHNSDLLGAPIEHPKKFTTNVPKIVDVELLFALHRAVVSKLGFDNKAIFMPGEGGELSYLVHSFKSDLAQQASLGCLTLDVATNCFRPTWAGAFLMGWYSMWPLGPLMRRWQRMRARFKIRSLERANV